MRHVVTCVVVAAAVTGCGPWGGDVEVEPPAPPEAAAGACNRLAGELPAEVDGEPARETRPQSTLTAAWGDPAIVLRCGVERPAALEPTSRLVSVNEVDWFLEELPDGYRFTTTDREVHVEVLVPDEYAPEVNPLVDLAPAITSAVPVMDG